MLANVFSLMPLLRPLQTTPIYQMLVELLLIGSAVFFVVRFLQGTRGARLLKGVVFLLISLFAVVKVLSFFFELTRIEFLYNSFLVFAAVAIIVVFQPELRRALMQLGETRLFRRLGGVEEDDISQIVRACRMLAERRVGALIVLEREENLASLTGNATRLNADITEQLIASIFWPNSPLHDLGMIIAEGRIMWAGVQLPLAESTDLDRELGSRHRAALGMSQETDAMVIVVSEETGAVSVAERGQLYRKLSIEQLRDTLLTGLTGNSMSNAGMSQAPAKPREEPKTERIEPRPVDESKRPTDGPKTVKPLKAELSPSDKAAKPAQSKSFAAAGSDKD